LRSTSISRALALASALALGGCTNVFFQPSRDLYYRGDLPGMEMREVRFKSADGTQLTGAFFPAKGAPKGTVIQFHGNAQNMTAHFLYAYWLVKAGYNLFVFDYRGYGASEGKVSLPGAVEDGEAALRALRTIPEVDPDRIVVLGQSLGAALAVASLAQARVPGVRAVILESPFASYRAMARSVLSRFWLTWPFQWPISGLVSARYEPYRFAAKLPAVPVLVIHGDADPVVPYSQGKALFDAIAPPKDFWTISGGGHLEAFTRFGKEYCPKLLQFLDKALR